MTLIENQENSMKKNTIIVLLIHLVVIVCLVSGCLEQKTTTVYNQSPTAYITTNITRGKTPLNISFNGFGADVDGTITYYHWDFGDGTTSIEQNPMHTYIQPGTYTITLTVLDNNNATGTDTFPITVLQNNKPIVRITASTVRGDAPLSVYFIGQGTDSDGIITNYSWDFGDGNTSTKQNLLYVFQKNGTYPVVLTMTDDNGATNSSAVVITVTQPSAPQINTFLININGKNYTIDQLFSLGTQRSFVFLNYTGVALDDLMIKLGIQNPEFHQYTFIGDDNYQVTVKWKNLKNGVLTGERRAVFSNLAKGEWVRNVETITIQ
ncbi:MAG: PKD domain-containing protein [Euryarchaeota archaeon]|nr:PKD domain-containing protein [Euryarchaeota archaeon]